VQSAVTTLLQQLLTQLSRHLFSRAVSSAVQFSRQLLQQLPQSLVGHVLAVRQEIQVSSAAIAVSLSPHLHPLVGHAHAVRQVIQVSSAATVVSLSLQQLLQLALSAVGSLQTVICLSSALSVEQRSVKIRFRFLNKSITEAVSMRQPLYVKKITFEMIV